MLKSTRVSDGLSSTMDIRMVFISDYACSSFLAPNGTLPLLDVRHQITALPTIVPLCYWRLHSQSDNIKYRIDIRTLGQQFLRRRFSTKVGVLLLLSVPYLIINFGAIPVYQF